MAALLREILLNLFAKIVVIYGSMAEAHQIALLHTKAYRILRQDIARLLNPFEVTMLEWVLLCSLDLEKGIRLSHVASYIGVEAPLISQLINTLQGKGLVKLTQDQDDRRAKRLILTVNGHKLVLESNQQVGAELDHCLRALNADEMSVHLKALDAIIRHDD